MLPSVTDFVRCSRPLGAALLACLGACVGGESTSGTVGPVVVGQEDIRIVGTSQAIAHIEDVMPLPDGAAWVLNSTAPFLIHLSPEGETVRVAGERGGGPGEFSWPTTLVRDPSSGDVLVYQPTQGWLIPVPNEPAGEQTLSAVNVSSPIRLNSYEWLWTNNGGRAWIEGTAEGFVFAEPSTGLPWIFSLWSTEVARLGEDGRLERIVSTAEVVGDPSTHFPGVRRFLPYPIWTACPDGSLAVYDPNENVLRRLSATGQEVGSHLLPPERRVSMTAERVFTTVYPGVLRNRLMVDPPERDVLYEMFRRDYTNRASEFAAVFPEYVHLDCSSPDTLWLQVFDSANGQMGRGAKWLRVSVDGEIATVEFPLSFRPMRFDEGRIWGTHTGDYDVEYVAWTELRDQ